MSRFASAMRRAVVWRILPGSTRRPVGATTGRAGAGWAACRVAPAATAAATSRSPIPRRGPPSDAPPAGAGPGGPIARTPPPTRAALRRGRRPAARLGPRPRGAALRGPGGRRGVPPHLGRRRLSLVGRRLAPLRLGLVLV